MTANTRIGAFLAGTLVTCLLACNGVTADEPDTADPAATEPDTADVAAEEQDAGDVAQVAAEPGSLPDAPGKDETMQGCLAGCHQPAIFNQSYTAQEWQQCVVDMINLGAPITEDNYMPIVLYLTKNLVKE